MTDTTQEDNVANYGEEIAAREYENQREECIEKNVPVKKVAPTNMKILIEYYASDDSTLPEMTASATSWERAHEELSAMQRAKEVVDYKNEVANDVII